MEKEPIKLKMYDDVFREQVKMGIIEKIPNIDEFVKLHPECSFMSHMGVYRMDHESTKLRVVFLSNLCERKRGETFSHNQVMLPGPCLNAKMTTAITMLRFDKYLITFDLKKAFLSIKLNEIDQNRLLFMWYNNVCKNDYKLVAYKCLRLPFGLVSSPFILMAGLYKILMLDKTDDEYLNNLKKCIYNSMYVDNGSYTTNEVEDLYNSYAKLPDVFSPYQFGLQQFYTNHSKLQSIIDADNDCTPDIVKLFGLNWDRIGDTISPNKLKLDEHANTKRKVLRSLNEVYDVFNVYAPMLLRAKLFMQKLQTMKDLDWDTKISDDLKNEWVNIAKQASSTPLINIKRSMGKRNGDYSLIVFTDASKDAFGCVLYMKDNETNEISFLMSKNKLLSSDMKRRTMPNLELQGIEFGVETLMDVYKNLSGNTVVVPINISALHVFTDNTACLHWLLSYSVKFDKMQKLSVFVNNRLSKIEQLCEIKPVSFRHVTGEDNPADYVSRPFSYRVLNKTNFYDGPEFLQTPISQISPDTAITIPNPILRFEDAKQPEVRADPPHVEVNVAATDATAPQHLVPVERYSEFTRMVRVHRNVLLFVSKLKYKVAIRNKSKVVDFESFDNRNLYNQAYIEILRTEQSIHYPGLLEYFQSKQKAIKCIPDLVVRLNLFLDKYGIIRVQGKMPPGKDTKPALLPKDSPLVKIIIREIHENLQHGGIYSVLRELRKTLWICQYFSTVKKVLKQCVICRRINEPAIKLNQSNYREFRINPDQKPFSNICIDYAGPFMVSLQGEKIKIWLLLVTCLYTRGVNIKICRSANLDEFLRALQMHVIEYGIFSLCISDLGTQIVAGANLIATFLSDRETREYFECNGMKLVKFQQFCKGNSSLGSLIEICVKLTKQLLHKTIRTIVLDYFHFEFILCKTIDLVNKRPIAFRESLRNLPECEIPFSITPEILIKGYETNSINIVPQLQTVDDDLDFIPHNPSSSPIHEGYERLVRVKSNLIDVYHSEFVTTLINQAIDKKDRYAPVNHKILKPGDIVLLIDKHLKRYRYPMARVQRVEGNALGEVTAAYVYKGSTRELVYRHATSMILLISADGFPKETDSTNSTNTADTLATDSTDSSDTLATDSVRRQPRRAAADNCRTRLRALVESQ